MGISPRAERGGQRCTTSFSPRPRAISYYERLNATNVLSAAGDANHGLGALKDFPHHRRIGHTALV
jgi:hypothetical protein